MAKIHIQENNYSIQVKRKILNKGTPILDENGEAVFKLLECTNDNALFLHYIEIPIERDKKKLQNGIKIARKVAFEMNKNLFTEQELEEIADIVNFVKSSDNKLIPITYDEAKELNKIMPIDIELKNEIEYKIDKMPFCEKTRKIKIPENVKINIINNIEKQEKLADNCIVLKTENGDFSNVNITSDIKREHMIVAFNKNAENIKFPEKISDDNNVEILPREIRYSYFSNVIELPKYREIKNLLNNNKNIKLRGDINYFYNMIEDMYDDFKSGNFESFEKLTNDKKYSYIDFFDTVQKILEKHPEFFEEIYKPYKDKNFYTPIKKDGKTLFDKMIYLKDTIIENKLENKCLDLQLSY